MALFKKRAKRRPHNEATDASVELASKDSIGRTLRRAREARGYDLQSVSQVLRVRFLYLDAIEKDIFDRLPGPVYALGFIRTYAEYLGLDAERIVRRYKMDVEAPGNDENLSFPTPKTATKVPPGVIFLVALLVAVLAYSGWYYLSQRRDGADPLSAALPDSFSTLFNGVEETGVPSTGTATKDEGPRQDETASSPELTSDTQTGGDTSAPSSPTERSVNAQGESGDSVPDAEEFGQSQAALTSEEQASVDENVPPREVEEEVSTTTGVIAEGVGEPATAEAGPTQDDVAEAGNSDLDLDDLPLAPGELEAAPTLTPQAPPGGAEVTSQGTGLEIGVPLADNVVGNNGNALEIPAIPDSASGAPGPQGPAVFGAENGETRVRLVATEDCWVQVRNAGGELLLTRVLRPGESYQVPDETGIMLFTGNAGGLQIYVDGRLLPLLGLVGEVKRDVLLEPDSLLGIDSPSDSNGLLGTVGSVE